MTWSFATQRGQQTSSHAHNRALSEHIWKLHCHYCPVLCWSPHDIRTLTPSKSLSDRLLPFIWRGSARERGSVRVGGCACVHVRTRLHAPSHCQTSWQTEKLCKQHSGTQLKRNAPVITSRTKHLYGKATQRSINGRSDRVRRLRVEALLNSARETWWNKNNNQMAMSWLSHGCYPMTKSVPAKQLIRAAVSLFTFFLSLFWDRL